QLSTMAITTRSTGFLSVDCVWRAELPEQMSTTSSGPAPTASAATRGFPESRPSSSRAFTTRSLSPSRFGSLRVETTVPTTLASCIGSPFGRAEARPTLLLRRRCGRAAERHDHVDLIVRPGDHVHGDDIADAACRRLRRVARRANGRDIAANDDRGV